MVRLGEVVLSPDGLPMVVDAVRDGECKCIYINATGVFETFFYPLDSVTVTQYSLDMRKKEQHNLRSRLRVIQGGRS